MLAWISVKMYYICDQAKEAIRRIWDITLYIVTNINPATQDEYRIHPFIQQPIWTLHGKDPMALRHEVGMRLPVEGYASIQWQCATSMPIMTTKGPLSCREAPRGLQVVSPNGWILQSYKWIVLLVDEKHGQWMGAHTSVREPVVRFLDHHLLLVPCDIQGNYAINNKTSNVPDAIPMLPKNWR